ncbi:DUF5710 domain-containing protein [Photorhabdus sp. RM71S]|uniref:DUF5710 domain-containing protein n=1 Tax=Photorhabdus sp. RM71S TaxID=3342824 RepID=UPI0036DC2D69
MATTRTYLAVPHSDKDLARKVAGKLADGKSALQFDKKHKLWYTLPGANMEALKPWQPDPHVVGVTAGDALTQFADFLRANRADLQGQPVMDGSRQRIRMTDDKPGKKSCTYVGHLDGLPNGWFNDFRDEGKENQSTWFFSGEEPEPKAALQLKAITAQNQWNRAEAKRQLQDKKAGNVNYVYGRFAQAGHQHPYLTKKGVQAAKGVHIDDKQRLLIPLRNIGGAIRSMQTIDTEGNKRLTKDAEKTGNFFVVGGSLKNGQPIVFAEGYATAASGAMALRIPVVMAIDSGNLVKVAERIHKRYPYSPTLFLGDDDPPKPNRPGNPGKEAAEKAAQLTDGIAVLPQFTQEEREKGLTDFNDLHQSRGLEALTEQLMPHLQALRTQISLEPLAEPKPSPPITPNHQENQNIIGEGPLDKDGQLLYAVGDTDAQSIYTATGHPVVVAVNGADMLFQANELHAQYPNSQHVFLTDTDIVNGSHLSAIEAVTQHTGADAIFPEFTREEVERGLRTIYDLHPLRGLTAFSEWLSNQLNKAYTMANSNDIPPQEAPDVAMTSADNVPFIPELENPEDMQAAYEAWAAEVSTSPEQPLSTPEIHIDQVVADNTLMTNPSENYPEQVNAEQPENVKARRIPQRFKPEVLTALSSETGNTASVKDETAPASVKSDNAPSLASLLKKEKPSPPSGEDEASETPSQPPKSTSGTEQTNTDAPPEADNTASVKDETSLLKILKNLLKKEKPSPPSGEDEASETPSQPPKSTSGTEQTNTNVPTEPDGINIIYDSAGSPARERIDLIELESALTTTDGAAPGSLDFYLQGQHAFTDYTKNGRIIMANPAASKDDRMILCALMVAKKHLILRGHIELTGSPEFKQRAIDLIAEYNLPLVLKNEEQRKMLETAREKLQSEPPLPDEPTTLGSKASQILVHPIEPEVKAERVLAAATDLPLDILPQKAPAKPPRNASNKEAKSGITGTLIEHGSAPYNFQKEEQNSYYARLRTAHGERILWGIELRTALTDSGLKEGDLTTLTLLGKKSVIVEVKQKDKDGNFIKDAQGNVITSMEERERNHWQAKPAIDPTVVNTNTRQMTPPGKLLAYSLQEYQALQATVTELAKKADAALPQWPNLPDALWMEPNGKGISAPKQVPDNPNLPSPSRHAGQVLFQAMDETDQLKLLLVKAQGDFVQGVVRHNDRYKPVLGRICKSDKGKQYMTLNEITPDGLKLLGTGNPVNNETGGFNNYVFRLKDEANRLYAQGIKPEKRDPALHKQLGFERVPVAPDQSIVRRGPESTHRQTPTAPRPGR